MQATLLRQEAPSSDYVGSYERAMREVILACGSRQSANSMISELQQSYEGAAARLKKAGSEQAREEVFRAAKADAERIIEKYAPKTGSHFHELVISYSFGALLLTLPLVAAPSLLMVATGIAAAGGAYYISAKVLGSWKSMVAKKQVSSLSGKVAPRHIKLPGFGSSKKK